MSVALCTGVLSAKSQDPDVLVVSDALTGGEAPPEPTADNPVYYIFLGGTEQDIGGSIAGIPSPTAAQMREVVARELARRHSIETQLGGPLPQLAVILAWGTAALDTFEQYDSETGESTNIAFNEREMRRLLGFTKVQPRPFRKSETDHLNDALNSDRFYILVAALDAMALRQREKKLVWRTRISIDARRTDLVKSMGVMIASAGPFFGRHEDRPVVVDDMLRKNTQVDVGEATVVGTDVPAPPAK
jgi:hypothetical protein